MVSSPRAFAYVQLAVDERFLFNTTSFDAKRDTPGLSGSPIIFAATAEGLYPDNLDIVQASVNDTNVWERLDADQVSSSSLRLSVHRLCVHEFSEDAMDRQLTCGQCARAYMQNFLRDRSDVIVVTNVTTVLQSQPSVLGASSAGW